jgi:hypothetical protein
MLLSRCFALDFTNRMMHEMQLSESGLILLIPVFESIAYGVAYGLLIAFFLWQFTPLLLAYAKVSEKRQKTTLLWFKGLVFFVGVLDAVNTIWTVVNYITEAILIVENKSISNYGHTIRKLDRASVVGAGAVDVAFNALYFICVFAFAVVACMALRTEYKGKTLDRPTQIYLPTLAISIVLRGALDLAWSVTFNLLTDFRNINITITYRLIHSVLYGFFSVVVYASILGITAHNDPRDSEARHDLVRPPKDWDKPSYTAMCLLCGLGGLWMRRRMVDNSAGMAQPSHAQTPLYGAAHGTPFKQMDASGSYYSVPQSTQGPNGSTSYSYVPPSPLKYGSPPPQHFESRRNYFNQQNGPQSQWS